MKPAQHKMNVQMDSTSRPIGICVVEDDAGFRSGLERLFSRTPDFRCLGFFASGRHQGFAGVLRKRFCRINPSPGEDSRATFS